MNLDVRYPHLSALVQEVLGTSLVDLSNRAPATGFDFFDLERLLSHVARIACWSLDTISEEILRLHHQQVQGYVSTIEAFTELGVVRDRATFVSKKLLAPQVALSSPPREPIH